MRSELGNALAIPIGILVLAIPRLLEECDSCGYLGFRGFVLKIALVNFILFLFLNSQMSFRITLF